MDRGSKRGRGLSRDEAMEEEVNEEFEHHLEMRTRENIAAGMTPEEARRDALRRFGDVEVHRRRTRAIDRRMQRDLRRTQYLDGARRTVAQAARALLRQPGFTVVSVVTLALGLGAATAIFTLLEAVVLRPLPYPHEDRVVVIEHPVPKVGEGAAWGLSAASYFYYREHSRSTEEIGVYRTYAMSLAGEGDAERVRAAAITATLQDVLGARAAHGRLIGQGDDARGSARVVLLDHGFWQRRYGGDAGVVGRSVQLDGATYEVAGVLAPGVDLPWSKVDVWLPLALDPAERAYNNHVFAGLARLRERVTAEAASADLARLAAQFPSVFPEAYSPAFMSDTRFTAAAVPLRGRLLGEFARLLWILFGSVALVLLIACANVANLFLVRAEARRREVGIRTALGASRRDLAWHYIAESVLLSVVAACASLILAHFALGLLVALAPTRVPHLDSVGIKVPGVLFAGGVALLAGITFGLFPLARTDRSVSALREGGRSATTSRPRQRLRGTLVAGQVALALVLLASAALLLQSFRNLQRVELGVDARGVLAFEVALPRRYDTDEKVNDFYRELTTRLQQLPGATHAGVSDHLPVSGAVYCSSIFIEDRPLRPGEEAPCIYTPKVSPGFVESLGLDVRGRSPSWTTGGAAGTAMVTQALADRLWPGEAALGRGIRVNGDEPPYYEVVGVIPTLRASGPDEPPTEAVFFPILAMPGASLWSPSRAVTVTLRTTSEHPESYLAAAKRIVAELDADVPVANPRSLDRDVAAATARTSFTAVLLLSAAFMALLLSMVGLYAVISYVVSQRTAELGIRMALGASVQEVGALVVRQAMRLVVAGIGVGLLGAVALTRSLRALLFGVSPGEPWILAVVAVALLAVALAASWAPARRAAKLDPLDALRRA